LFVSLLLRVSTILILFPYSTLHDKRIRLLGVVVNDLLWILNFELHKATAQIAVLFLFLLLQPRMISAFFLVLALLLLMLRVLILEQIKIWVIDK
jgi:hypothetical protein